MSLPPPRRRTLIIDRVVRGMCMAAVWLPIAAVAVWIGRLVALAWPGLGPAAADVAAAALDSLALVVLTAVLAIPTGVGAAVYLEEYGVRGRVGALIEFHLAALGGVPSVIYGLLGLKLFVRTLELRLSLLVGAATLALLILPMVTDGARAALRSVGVSQREAGLALGGTRWQVVRHVVLPRALRNMLCAALLAVARALGEAAPLLVLGAVVAGLPVEIYGWLLDGQPERAAAGALVLLAMTLGLATIAAVLRPEHGAASGRLR